MRIVIGIVTGFVSALVALGALGSLGDQLIAGIRTLVAIVDVYRGIAYPVLDWLRSVLPAWAVIPNDRFDEVVAYSVSAGLGVAALRMPWVVRIAGPALTAVYVYAMALAEASGGGQAIRDLLRAVPVIGEFEPEAPGSSFDALVADPIYATLLFLGAGLFLLIPYYRAAALLPKVFYGALAAAGIFYPVVGWVYVLNIHADTALPPVERFVGAVESVIMQMRDEGEQMRPSAIREVGADRNIS